MATRRIDDCLSNRAGRLYVEECDTLDLVAEFGSPLFVFSEDQLRRNVRRFPALPGRLARRTGRGDARGQGQLAGCGPAHPGRRGVRLRHLLRRRADHGPAGRLPPAHHLGQRRAQG